MKKTTNLIQQHILWRGLYFFSVLLINIGIARFFAAEKSGQLFYIINNLALILLVVGLSLESGITFYIASAKLESRIMAGFCSVWTIAASVVAFSVWCFLLYLSHSVYLTDISFLLAGFLFISGTLYTTYFTALFYAEKEFGLPNKILFLVNIFIVMVLIVGKTHPFIRAHFVMIYFSGFFLQGILLRSFFMRKDSVWRQHMVPSRVMLEKVFRYSLVALSANLIYFLVNRVDYWFVAFYCSPRDLGNYIQASKLGQMLVILPSILGATLFPIFSSGNNAQNETQLTAVIRVLFCINGIICVAILGLGWFMIPLVFGTSFNQLYLLFILLIPGILCITMNYPMAAWFSSSHRIGVNIRGSLLAFIVICLGDLLMLPRLGVTVAPVVSSAGYFSYYFYTIFIYRKEHDVPLKDFLLIRKSDLNRILQSIGDKWKEPIPENPVV
jgi:O-antigen/teichoic acid export membrane protein